MTALIASSEVVTCFGDGDATFAALLAGRTGVERLRHVSPDEVRVTHGYHVDDTEQETALRASRMLTRCLRRAFVAASVDPSRQRVKAIVGTGLRELRSVERWSLGDDEPPPTESLHFSDAVRAAVPGCLDVVTIANACSAGGYALAIAQDVLTDGDADVVVVGGVDVMTASMLAMIGRVTDPSAEQVRPFDRNRRGVLLGEGAAAVVVVAPDHAAGGLAQVLATGLSCDAHHDTAPDIDGVTLAMVDAHERAGVSPAEIDLVVAHGTGTKLNDPMELAALTRVLGRDAPGTMVTALKGAVGHTSGGSPLLSLDVAIRCVRNGVVPAIVGLETPIDEAAGLDLVVGAPRRTSVDVAQVDAFGFGGVNAVTIVSRLP